MTRRLSPNSPRMLAAARKRAAEVMAKLAARSRPIWGRVFGAKADGNSAELDAEFVARGCSVVRLDVVGDDVPDRIIGAGGRDAFAEYKSADGELSPGQEVFTMRWRGGLVWEIRSREDVVRMVNALRGGQ